MSPPVFLNSSPFYLISQELEKSLQFLHQACREFDKISPPLEPPMDAVYDRLRVAIAALDEANWILDDAEHTRTPENPKC